MHALGINRPLSLGVLKRNFDDVVLLDHFLLESFTFFHVKDSKTSFLAVSPVTFTSLAEDVRSFELLRVSAFWLPEQVRGDQAFANREFTEHARSRGLSLAVYPPRRHSRNSIESKHKIIRDTYFCLKD